MEGPDFTSIKRQHEAWRGLQDAGAARATHFPKHAAGDQLRM